MISWSEICNHLMGTINFMLIRSLQIRLVHSILTCSIVSIIQYQLTMEKNMLYHFVRLVSKKKRRKHQKTTEMLRRKPGVFRSLSPKIIPDVPFSTRVWYRSQLLSYWSIGSPWTWDLLAMARLGDWLSQLESKNLNFQGAAKTWVCQKVVKLSDNFPKSHQITFWIWKTNEQ